MFLRSSPVIALVLALTGLAGCSGGGAGGTAVASTGCGPSNGICLTSCNLSCTSTGCLRTDIAQNETIILEFNKNIDVGSVNSSSIRFRTAAGAEPVGEYIVENNVVKFVPTLLLSGNSTYFGFQSGETYTMTIVGGSNQPEIVRSTSGTPFGQTLSCTLNSVLGIVDQNGVAPRASMVVPSLQQVAGAPLDTQIILEFNEMIDITPFLGAASEAPVHYRARRTLIVDPTTGQRACDPASQSSAIDGTLTPSFDAASNRTILTFTPTNSLSGNLCIDVIVTDAVTDVSGRSAQPQTFSFLTTSVAVVEDHTVEEFDDATMLDPLRSAGDWVNGQATFANIGGDGSHGTIDAALFDAIRTGVETNYFTYLGSINGLPTFQIDTDLTVVPAAYTKSGVAIPVTDGHFYFDHFLLPENTALKFTGSKAPVITVAGVCDIQGRIDVRGESLVAPATLPSIGQAGGFGGIAGGRGGKGGNRNVTPSGAGAGGNPVYLGEAGVTGTIPQGHAYGSVSQNRAGSGSNYFPLDGLSASVYLLPPPIGLFYTPTAAAPGGGGGLMAAGTAGAVLSSTGGPTSMGPPAAGGNAMTLFPLPATARSSSHFLIGGSGGGGGGSHPLFGSVFYTAPTYNTGITTWAIGLGGGGGGGAVALRAGDLLRVGATGELLASGGSAADYTATGGSFTVPNLGGGGSGGSLVLQSGSQISLSGAIDVRGGSGGHCLATRGTGATAVAVELQGGNGSAGFVRCELPTAPSTAVLATMQPAATADNVGPLTETDDLVSFQSKFYDTQLLFGPEYVRYVIHATVNSQPVVYSDDPAYGNPATAGAAIRVAFQCAQLDTSGNVLEIRPWRGGVRSVGGQTGIASDGLAAFRFQITKDRQAAANVTIDQLEVVYNH